MKSSIDCIIFFSGNVSNIIFIHQKFIFLRVNFQSSAQRVASCASYSCVIKLTFGVCCSGRKSWIWINWIIFIWFSISYLSRLIRLIMSCIFGCGAPCIFKLMFSVRCRQQRETWILINSLPKCLFMMGPPLKRICSLTKLQRKFHWDGNLRNSKIIPHFFAFFF